MRLLILLALIGLSSGCGADNGADTRDDVALAEAQARIAEAEARAAEARLLEAETRSAETQTARPPAAELAPPPPAEEPPLDYERFARPASAVVRTQHDGQITLRTDPDADASRVVRVADGTRVEVLGCQAEARVRTDAAASGTPGRWCFVRTGPHRGWAFDAYLVF